MHEFGTTREQLAEVAVAARAWAQRNQRAWSRDPLSVDDVLGAPHGLRPARRARLLPGHRRRRRARVVAAERAADLRRAAGPRARLRRGALAPPHLGHARPDDHAPRSQSGARAFAEAGLAPRTSTCLQLYDAFTITPILFLEDLGFCAKGEGGAFVEGGRIAPGGALPVNTNGGGLSYCHPGMYGLLAIVEAVRQVPRARAAHVALAHGNGGVLSSQAPSCSAARARGSVGRWTST